MEELKFIFLVRSRQNRPHLSTVRVVKESEKAFQVQEEPGGPLRWRNKDSKYCLATEDLEEAHGWMIGWYRVEPPNTPLPPGAITPPASPGPFMPAPHSRRLVPPAPPVRGHHDNCY